MLEIKVCEIRGKCPVPNVGDRIVIDGPKVVLEQTDAVCVHSLSSLLHYVIALDENVDPGEPYTDGGTVIFKCERVEQPRRV